MDVILRKADLADAQLLWQMQVESFRKTYETYRDDQTTPYLEKMERTVQRINEPVTSYYVIEADGAPVGGIRVRDYGTEKPRCWDRCMCCRKCAVKALRRRPSGWLKTSTAGKTGCWIPFCRKKAIAACMRRWVIGRQAYPKSSMSA